MLIVNDSDTSILMSRGPHQRRMVGEGNVIGYRVNYVVYESGSEAQVDACNEVFQMM